VVAARREGAARAAAALATGAEPRDWQDLARQVTRCDVVVNATPLGMRGEDPPFDPAAIGSRHVVVDTVYHPAETPLLAAARARGAKAANGLGMLVGQAACSFTLLTGQAAPVDVMTDAARRALTAVAHSRS
jgi:shikimate dehydrogenase